MTVTEMLEEDSVVQLLVSAQKFMDWVLNMKGHLKKLQFGFCKPSVRAFLRALDKKTGSLDDLLVSKHKN